MSGGGKRVGFLRLEDGTVFKGTLFGEIKETSGEVVFNTGMTGYVEALTDPSYKGEILVFTFPLIGNYGVPRHLEELEPCFESSTIHTQGVVVSSLCTTPSHYRSYASLGEWLKQHGVVGIEGVDTRLITKILREKGTMLGAILFEPREVEYFDPSKQNVVDLVSPKRQVEYKGGDKKVVLMDCGCKNGILYELLSRNISVTRVPWDTDVSTLDWDGLLVSNGPGDPLMCKAAISNIAKALRRKRPMLGICLGNQLISLAAGGRTYKLKYGHRSQNQPCIELRTGKTYVTSQNHGYAVDPTSLPKGWEVWFENLNDGTVEGVRHADLPFMSVQFHPEGRPGPLDTRWVFDEFVKLL